MDYSLREENFTRDSRKSDALAQLHYTSTGSQEPYSMELKRDRTHRGYGFNAPIHNDGEGMKTNFTLSRTRDYRWFSGLQFSFEF